MKKLILSLFSLLLIASVGGLLFLASANDRAVSETRSAGLPTLIVPASESAVGVFAVSSLAPEPVNTPDPVVPDSRRFSLSIANTGGDAELDSCADGFTHLVGFTTTAAVAPQRVLARHNNCGGDIVLGLEIGDVVEVVGEGDFLVVDTRNTPRDITPENIKGMKGDVLLQTCWHLPRYEMRFVGLEKVSF